MECAGVLAGVDVADGEVGAEVVAVDVEGVDVVFGLGFVEPEDSDALGVVVLLCLGPDVLSCGWVGGVEVHGVALEGH